MAGCDWWCMTCDLCGFPGPAALVGNVLAAGGTLDIYGSNSAELNSTEVYR